MPDDLEGLRVLLELLGPAKEASISDVDDDAVVTPELPCGVPNCHGSAVFRCETGFRYCARHARSHGEFHEKHQFSLMRKISAKTRADAQETISDRIREAAYGDSNELKRDSVEEKPLVP